MHRVARVAIILAVIVAAQVGTSGAGDIGQNVFLHGYGGWVYGETDGNLYLNGTGEGSYRNADFALNVIATPTDRLTLFGQVQFWVTPDGEDVDLDYAFADWRCTPRLNLRIGQVKHPFGIYAEIFDVGTLRPFFDLPQGIYGRQGIVAEAYRGAGLVGNTPVGEGWGLQYDLYFGELEASSWHPAMEGVAVAFGQEIDPDEFAFDSRELIGGRLVVKTPVPGLSFGTSVYAGKAAEGASEGDAPSGPEVIPDFPGDRTTWGVHLEYLGESLWVRAEYATLDVTDATFDGAYAEVAYRFGEHWQVAARYDHGTISGIPDDPAITNAEVFDHEDIAAALNYWFTTEMVVRVEFHRVDGTRFAAPGPDDYLPDLITGEFKTETELVQVGVQFSF
jgi:hypothetical protein